MQGYLSGGQLRGNASAKRPRHAVSTAAIADPEDVEHVAQLDLGLSNRVGITVSQLDAVSPGLLPLNLERECRSAPSLQERNELVLVQRGHNAPFRGNRLRKQNDNNSFRPKSNSIRLAYITLGGMCLTFTI